MDFSLAALGGFGGAAALYVFAKLGEGLKSYTEAKGNNLATKEDIKIFVTEAFERKDAEKNAEMDVIKERYSEIIDQNSRLTQSVQTITTSIQFEDWQKKALVTNKLEKLEQLVESVLNYKEYTLCFGRLINWNEKDDCEVELENSDLVKIRLYCFIYLVSDMTSRDKIEKVITQIGSEHSYQCCTVNELVKLKTDLKNKPIEEGESELARYAEYEKQFRKWLPTIVDSRQRLMEQLNMLIDLALEKLHKIVTSTP